MSSAAPAHRLGSPEYREHVRAEVATWAPLTEEELNLVALLMRPAMRALRTRKAPKPRRA